MAANFLSSDKALEPLCLVVCPPLGVGRWAQSTVRLVFQLNQGIISLKTECAKKYAKSATILRSLTSWLNMPILLLSETSNRSKFSIHATAIIIRP